MTWWQQYKTVYIDLYNRTVRRIPWFHHMVNFYYLAPINQGTLAPHLIHTKRQTKANLGKSPTWPAR